MVETTTCSECQKPSTSLVEVFVKDLDELSSRANHKRQLCGNCLIGWNVPVFRQTSKTWVFGHAETLNEATMQHCIVFANGEREFTFVDPYPFTSYVNHFEQQAAASMLNSHSFDSSGHLSMMNCDESETSKNALPNSIFRLGSSSPLHLDQYEMENDEGLRPPRKEAAVQTKPRVFKQEMILNPKRQKVESKGRVLPLKRGSGVWNPREDAMLFRLYYEYGSNWAKISKLFRGKSEEQTAKRFEQLAATLHQFHARSNGIAAATQTKNYMEPKAVKETSVAFIRETNVLDKKMAPYFGPFLTTRNGELCGRCGLTAPSKQTSASLCQATGWCRTCAMMPAFCSGDTIRKFYNARR